MRILLRLFSVGLMSAVPGACVSYNEDGALVRHHIGYVRVVTPTIATNGASVQALQIETLGVWADVDRRGGASQQGSGAGLGWRSDQRDFFPMDPLAPADCRFVLRVSNSEQFEQARLLIESHPNWREGCIVTDHQ